MKIGFFVRQLRRALLDKQTRGPDERRSTYIPTFPARSQQ
jgi:hypothetical protein